MQHLVSLCPACAGKCGDAAWTVASPQQTVNLVSEYTLHFSVVNYRCVGIAVELTARCCCTPVCPRFPGLGVGIVTPFEVLLVECLWRVVKIMNEVE